MASKLLLSLLALSLCIVELQAAADDDAPQPPQFPLLPPVLDDGASSEVKPRELDFQLRHVFHHGTHRHPDLHRRLDVNPEAPLFVTTDEDQTSGREPAARLHARSSPLHIQRMTDRSPSHINSILEVGRMTGKAVDLPASAWTVDEIPGPNVSDKETVLSFARMASNAYIIEPGTGEWEDVGGGFNYTEDFGWESDGLRGHIFADTENSTIVIGLKGTSMAVFDGSETTTNDKVNDNLFFSCCCAQGGSTLWRQVCDCMTSTYSCNSTCLVGALHEKNRYYYAAQDLYHNVTALYPKADVWVAGHSLGGSTSSLLALTFGLPVVTFEAPGEAMAAGRLGLPTPPGFRIGAHQERILTGGYHFGQTADPLYLGTCNTAWSLCSIAGYAMQSTCHSGMECTYDTVKDYGWRPGLGNHKIINVIKMIDMYDAPANCTPRVNCTDCYGWNYYESNGTETTTSSKPSSTRYSQTRTSTCQTPGWWGCLDETPTSGSTTTTSTSPSSTSTCKTPGWFGCKDETTTTSSSSTSSGALPVPTITTSEPTSTSTLTSTCKTPGWFGCNDPTSTSSAVSSSSTFSPPVTPIPSPTTPSTFKTSTTCTSKEWFGLICVDPSSDSTASPTPTSSDPPPPVRRKGRCLERHWYGTCKKREGDLPDWPDLK